jgi:hypothetical protein
MTVWCAAVGVLIVRRPFNLQRLHPGFRVDGLVLVDLVVSYSFGEAPPDFPDRLDGIGARLEADPSVGAVTPMLSRPMIGDRGWSFVP